MKKQLFIGLLASALMVTTIPVTATAAATTTAPVAKITSTATTNSAITTTKSAISTTGTAITTTNGAVTTTSSALTTTISAITGPGISIATTTPAVVAPISLSLDGAYKKMLADSPQATLAKYTLDSDLSVAKGYSEKLSSIHQLERSNDEASKWALDTSNKSMLEANRTFGSTQAPKNYDASINKLKSQTYEMYYNYKYTEAQVQVAKDNLTRTQAIYNSTMLKFKLGTVSKLDTLTAETKLNTAKDNYAIAVNGFEQIKMNFNLFMGYNIHQKVALTDTLTALPFPAKNLDDGIKEALVNRNEINGANYNAEMAQYALDNVKAYPKSSATYLAAKSTLLMAQEGAKTAPEKVEIDVRTKYMDMKQKYDAVTSGKVSYENSKETSRLGQLQFDSGVITVTDLSGINLDTFNTQQAYYKAILDYNLAVDAYNLALGIGTETVTIK
ncbi:TolC family protein [Aminipila terrae]|uniref:TolC family protein n=1 Tax=Aminipila terrae TaxID=2697030 RepID=A0A6P1ME10_9FIRM|nr:TolC family protein [Aminipila terrae]QHI72071.1 TolC family protein [Aminipila terrae]